MASLICYKHFGSVSKGIFNRKVRREVAKIAKGELSIYKNVAYFVLSLCSLLLS